MSDSSLIFSRDGKKNLSSDMKTVLFSPLNVKKNCTVKTRNISNNTQLIVCLLKVIYSIQFLNLCKCRPFFYKTTQKLVLQYAFLNVRSNPKCKTFFAPQAPLLGPLLFNLLLKTGPVLSVFHSGFAKQLIKRAAVKNSQENILCLNFSKNCYS